VCWHGVSGELTLDGERDGIGKTASCLRWRAIDLAKFGRPFLNEGDWNGRRAIWKKRVIESTART
jgi:hypothetical protein